MAIQSMTGYGSAAAAARGCSIRVEISSVNRKQLDLQVRVARELVPLESRVFEMLREELRRGRVSGEVTLRFDAAKQAGSLRVDEDLAQAYVTQLRTTAKKLKLPDDLVASQLLVWPGVVDRGTPELDLEKLRPLLERVLRKARTNLLRMRREEGRALEKVLKSSLKTLVGFHAEISVLAQGLPGRHRQALIDRLKDAGVDFPENEPSLCREIALLADRSDVAEELDRLESHFSQTAKALRSSEAVGRRLDFLAQEMLREINTVGSKANHGEIAHLVISFKSELERFREQVQNVE